MSSTSMALNQRGITIGSSQEPATPGSLNTWLLAHSGYVAGTDDLEESAVMAIAPGRIRWTNSSMHRTNDIEWSAVVRILDAGQQACILNVDHGGHFVLAVGYDKAVGGDLLYVNDPGFHRQAYSYSTDVVGYRLYDLN